MEVAGRCSPRHLHRRVVVSWGHESRHRAPREGPPRGPRRGALAVVRGPRRLPCDARAGDAPAHRGHRAGPGRVPDHPPARGVRARPGRRPERRVRRPARSAPSWPRSAARTRSPWSRTWTPSWPWPTPSRSWATATTPTCTTGCGRTASPASTAARPRSTSARARASTPSTRARCEPRCSPVSGWRSPSPGESEDFGVDWDDPRALTATASGSRPSRGPGTALRAPSPAAPGAAASRSSSGSSPPDGSRPTRRCSTVGSCCWRRQRGAAPGPRVRLDPPRARRARAARRGGRRPAWPAPRLRLRARPMPTTARPGCAPSSATPRSSWSGATTPRPSSASASRSGTPGRSGSCRTAAPSPWTAPAPGLRRLQLTFAPRL